MHSNQTFINDGVLFFHHGYKSFASSYLLNLVQTTVQTKFYLQRIKNYVYLFTHACFFIFFIIFLFLFFVYFQRKTRINDAAQNHRVSNVQWLAMEPQAKQISFNPICWIVMCMTQVIFRPHLTSIMVSILTYYFI